MDEERSNRSGIIGGVVVVVAVVGVVFFMIQRGLPNDVGPGPYGSSRPPRQSPAGAGLSSSPALSNASEGEKSKLSMGTASTVFVFSSPEALGEFSKAADAKDDVGVSEMLLNGKILVVDANTEVLVIDSGFGTRRVRILAGDKAGQSGWVPVEFLH